MKKLSALQLLMLALLVAAALLFGFLMYKKKRRGEILELMESTEKFFGKLLPFHHLRKDKVGDGSYDPIEKGGTRPTKKHNGVDLIATPGSIVTSPINGKVVRKSFPYGSSSPYQGVLLKGTQEHAGIEFKIFYIIPDDDLIGKEVKKGDRIGIAQKISAKYPGALDHIHVEMYVENQIQDPTKALFA